MTPAELLSTFRREMGDVESPPLWDDEDIYAYIDGAQRKFCQLTRGIADSSSVACVVNVTAGEPFSNIHPSIRQIRSAHFEDGRQLALLDWGVVGGVQRDDYGRTSHSALSSTQGEVYAMVLGLEDDRVRWMSVPDTDGVVELVVFRGPLNTVSEATADRPLEVSDSYVDALLYWARHLGYSRQDAETFDRNAADRYEAKFYARCAEVRSDQERRVHVPRAVAYGGL